MIAFWYTVYVQVGQEMLPLYGSDILYFVLTESEQMYCSRGNKASSFNICFSKDTHSLPYKLNIYTTAYSDFRTADR